jgi:VWFA-related protein
MQRHCEQRRDGRAGHAGRRSTRRRGEWRLSFALGLTTSLTVLPVAWAQSTDSPDAPPRGALVEEVRVRLARTAILASDRAGRPVSDLTSEEIVVKERGRRMRVAFLEPFVEQDRPGADPPVRLYVGAPGTTESVAQSSGPEPRHVILFIDVENDYRLRKQEASESVAGFLRTELDPGYRAAVFSYDGEIHLEAGLTTNRDELAAAVARAYGRSPRPRLDLRARVRGLMEQLEACERSSGSVVGSADQSCLRGVMLEHADEVRPAAEGYLEALDRVIGYAAGLRGRATVLALSHGVAVDPAAELMEATRAVYGNTEQLAALRLEIGTETGARAHMDRLLESALQNGVTLHFIDRNPAPAGAADASRGTLRHPGAWPVQAAFTAAQAEIEQMAAATGGVFLHEADLHSGIEQAMDVERGAYLLGYYLDDNAVPERLSKVRIRSTRKGVKIRHHRSRFARSTAPSPVVGALSLGAALALEDEGREGEFLPFTIVADPRNLGYEPVGDVAVADFTLHVQVETGGGQVLAETFHLVNHAYSRRIWEANLVEPLQIHGWTELPPGDYRLTAYLRNLATGDDGELSREWTVASEAVNAQSAR